MIKFRLYYDKDKETAFLNEMSQKGYAMTGFFSGFYRFDSCQPGEYIYQVDITEGLFQVSSDYREFMRDMDVEIVCLWGPWVTLRKKASEGAFELYTDVESSIEHYTKIKTMFKAVAILQVGCLLVDIWGALNGVAIAWAFCFILGAMLVAFMKELARINDILAELKGRTGDGREKETGLRRRENLSGFLAAGLLLNGIVLMLPDTGTDGQMGAFFGFLKGFLQVLALFFLIIGCLFTFWRHG